MRGSDGLRQAQPACVNQRAKAARKAADVLARYNEVNVLFSSHFPGIDISGASRPSQATTPLPLSSHADGSSLHASDVHGNDSYDSDSEIAFGLKASMGPVRHPLTRHQLDALPAMPIYPRLASSCTSADVPTTIIPTTNDMYTGSKTEGGDNSSTQGLLLKQSPAAQSHPFSSPTTGKLLVTGSLSDTISCIQSPPTSYSTGDVVKDLGRLGDSLQQKARMQLRDLDKGGSTLSDIS